MFGRTAPQAESEEAKDVFAPVADLMVGVVFIFIVLMLALVMNLRNEDTVPRSRYDARVAEVRSLEGRLSAEILRVRALEAERAQLAQRLDEEIKRREAAEARLRALQEENARLIAFVRFIQENNLVQLAQVLADAQQTRTEVLNEIRDLLARSRIQVTVDPSTGTLRLPAGQLFEQGKAEPTPAGQELIRALARAMAQVLPCHDGSTTNHSLNCRMRRGATRLSAVYVEGHTDTAPLSSTSFPRDNWELSAARAIEAFRRIQEESEVLRALQNADREQLIGVSGYADTRPSSPARRGQRQRPVDDNDRRIEVRIVMATDEEYVNSLLRDLRLRLGQIDDLLQQR
jgi:chemotaxis protein MotB